MPTTARLRSAVAGLAAGTLVSTTTVAFVSGWEGTSYVPYKDIAGYWTVCTGHIQDVDRNRTYTAAECAALLAQDLEEHGAGVLACVKAPITEPQQVALVSLGFNIGVYAFCSSTLVRKLNALDYAGAAAQFERWNRADGKISKGLTNRRKAERALFMKSLPTPARSVG